MDRRKQEVTETKQSKDNKLKRVINVKTIRARWSDTEDQKMLILKYFQECVTTSPTENRNGATLSSKLGVKETDKKKLKRKN